MRSKASARPADCDTLEWCVRILETIDRRREMEDDPGIGRCVENQIVAAQPDRLGPLTRQAEVSKRAGFSHFRSRFGFPAC